MIGSMRVLVTGGSGFIGSAIVKQLSRAGIPTAVLDILEPCSACFPEGVSFYQGDVQDTAAGIEILRHFRPTHVIHNASKPSRRLETAETQMPQGELIGEGLVKAFSEFGVKKLIYASSAAVYGEVPDDARADESWPQKGSSLYAREKAEFESFLNSVNSEPNSGLQTVIFRYANVYGPGQRDGVVSIFIFHISQGLPVQLYGRRIRGDNGCLRDFIFIDDVVRANLLALTSDMQGTFNVGSGQVLSIADLLSALQQLVGTAITVIHKEPRPLEIKSSVLNPWSIMRHGWRRTVDLQEGLAETCRAAACRPAEEAMHASDCRRIVC